MSVSEYVCETNRRKQIYINVCVCLSLYSETTTSQSRQYRAITCLPGLLEAVHGTRAHYALNNCPLHTVRIDCGLLSLLFLHSLVSVPDSLHAAPLLFPFLPLRNRATSRRNPYIFSLPTLLSSSIPLLPLRSSTGFPFLPSSFPPTISSFSSSPSRLPLARRPPLTAIYPPLALPPFSFHSRYSVLLFSTFPSPSYFPDLPINVSLASPSSFPSLPPTFLYLPLLPSRHFQHLSFLFTFFRLLTPATISVSSTSPSPFLRHFIPPSPDHRPRPA